MGFVLKPALALCMAAGMMMMFCAAASSAGAPPANLAGPMPPVHMPVRINNDSDFDSIFPLRIISGLNIDATGAGCGIYVGNCTKTFTISDCHVWGASGNSATHYRNANILIYDSISGTIKNNYVSGAEDGIRLQNGDKCALYGNNCTQNGDGILIAGGSSQVAVHNNTVYNNSYYGIWLYNSGNCGIVYNDIIGNQDYGIKLHASSGNTLHHNNFLYNNGATTVWDPSHVQANDTSGGNRWNMSTGGNHWSDWKFPDTAPADGIVDTPYAMDGGLSAMDNMPLADPVKLTIPEGFPVATIGALIGTMLIIGICSRRKTL